MSKQSGQRAVRDLAGAGVSTVLSAAKPDLACPHLEECRVDTINPQISVLDEFKLRDELKAMRAQIPDAPGLNPIVNIGFYLSRSLESGKVSFEDLKALAGRLMDRACVR